MRKRAEAINARALEDALDSASRTVANLAGVKVRIEQPVHPDGIIFRDPRAEAATEHHRISTILADVDSQTVAFAPLGSLMVYWMMRYGNSTIASRLICRSTASA